MKRSDTYEKSRNMLPQKAQHNKSIVRKIIEVCIKRVHMARYGLILKQDGGTWLRIISKPFPAPERPIQTKNDTSKNVKLILSRVVRHKGRALKLQQSLA